MTGFDIVLIGVLVLTIVWAVWGLICNELTYRDRMKMLREADPGEEDFLAKMVRFEQVSYDEHYQARFWLRDPWRLYD